MKKIILASQSPRRKELLGRITDDFSVIPSNDDEVIDRGLAVIQQIEQLSHKKAYSVFKEHSEAIVIGADTVILFNNDVIGKPKNREDAYRILTLLKNNSHHVITAVTIISSDKCITFNELCEVNVGEITEEELQYYLDHEEYMDKSGAYAIQGEMSKYITSIHGDINTVIGLPVHALYQTLKDFL